MPLDPGTAVLMPAPGSLRGGATASAAAAAAAAAAAEAGMVPCRRGPWRRAQPHRPAPPLKCASPLCMCCCICSLCSYEADETPMPSYLNVHDTLEARRQAAQEATARQQQSEAAGGRPMEGPRTFVVGPTDSGKSTLCKILLNYAGSGAAGWQAGRAAGPAPTAAASAGAGWRREAHCRWLGPTNRGLADLPCHRCWCSCRHCHCRSAQWLGAHDG